MFRIMPLALPFILCSTALVACGNECNLSSQCPAAQFCDFDTHTCVLGCQSDDECGYQGTCDTTHGTCRSGGIVLPSFDASSIDGTADDAADTATSDAEGDDVDGGTETSVDAALDSDGSSSDGGV